MKAILCIHSASAEFIQTAFSHNEIKTLSLASLLSHRPRLQLSFLLLSLVPFFPLLRSVLARVGLQEFLPLLVSVERKRDETTDQQGDEEQKSATETKEAQPSEREFGLS